MKRELFEKAANTRENEIMPIVSPLGYPAKERADVDKKLRASVNGDERLDPDELFFDKDFNTPLGEDACIDILEAVRWYPSAANKQPCRIVKNGKVYHFYEKHPDGYQKGVAWDVQKIDMGIAICHLLGVTDGRLHIEDPGLDTDENTEYIASVTIE